VGTRPRRHHGTSEINRIYFQNVNGFRRGCNGLDILDFFCDMKSIGADIIVINEPNLNLQHPYIRRLFHQHQHQQQVWEHSKFAFSSSNIDTGLQKPGGTILGITGNLTSRVIKSTSGSTGRWASITLLGRLRAKITVICTYQVVNIRGASGPTTAFTQQLLMLKRQQREHQRPGQKHQNDLRSFLESKINDDHKIVLCGDLNEELGCSAGGMTQLASNLGLTGIHTQELGLDNKVATYARGTKLLDYILMTEQITSHTTNCGAEPFNHRFYSDHRGIWVDLELLGLFDRNLPPLARPQFRDIRSGRPKLVRKYVAELGKYLSSLDIPNRVNYLTT
jgi:endonuclease/exonuclease/phosphatase family metal-dependent hydrolase